MGLVGAMALAACGTDEGGPKQEAACTLPDCNAVAPLGEMGFPLLSLGESGLLSWYPAEVDRGALWHHGLDGTRRLVAEGVPARSVAADPEGRSVLYLQPERWGNGEWVGSLHRWDVGTGTDTLIHAGVRDKHFGACGDWVWAWHDMSGGYLNCGSMSARQLSSGEQAFLGESCDFGLPDGLALFSSDCSLVAVGPGAERGGVVVHELGKGHRQVVGTGSGRFLATPSLDRVVAPIGGSGHFVLATIGGEDEVRPTEEWPRAGAHGFSPSGDALVYWVEGDERILHLLAGTSSQELSRGFGAIESLAFSADERFVAWIEMYQVYQQRSPLLQLLDTATGTVTPIAGEAVPNGDGASPEIVNGPLHFSGDGSKLLHVRRKGAHGRELVLRDLGSGEAKLLGPLVGEPQVLEGRFVAWEGARRELRLASLETGTSWQVSERVEAPLFVGDQLVWIVAGQGYRLAMPEATAQP